MTVSYFRENKPLNYCKEVALREGGIGFPSDAWTSKSRILLRRWTPKLLGTRTSGHQKRCSLDANFFYILSKHSLIVNTLEKRERKRTRKKHLNYWKSWSFSEIGTLPMGGGIIGQFFQTLPATLLNFAPGPRNTE